MSKKSAVSKGYRKQTAKKPYLSKKEIIALCVLIVIVAVAAVLLFRYDDGALKKQDGKVVTDGDNWLIVDGSNVRGRTRYFKLAEVGEIEGYTREAEPTLTDVNVSQYVFTPEAEDAAVSGISVASSHNGAAALAKYTRTAMAETDGCEAGDVTDIELNGLPCSYFSFTYAPVENEEADAAEAEAVEEAADADAAEAETADEAADGQADGAEATEGESAGEAEDTEEPEDKSSGYTKAVYAYLDASHDSCIVIHVNCEAASPEEYPEDGVLLDALEQAVGAIALESGK